MRSLLGDVRWSRPLAIAAMFASMAIFGSNFAISRYAVRHGLTPPDLAALRFGVAGLVLLPYFLRMGGRDCAGLGWGRGALLAAAGGVTVTLLTSFGVQYAPAAHGAALAPGTVTIVGVIYAAIVAGRVPALGVLAGLALAVAGLATIALGSTTSGSSTTAFGDLLFFCTGLVWGFYPVLLHRWQVPGLKGVTICAVISLAYVPVYLLVLQPQLSDVPLLVLVVQGVYQGILNAIVALWLWGHGVKVLGAGGTQLFPPLLPVIGAACAIPILGEWPGPFGSAGVALIVAGIAVSAIASRRAARRSI